MNSGKNYAKLMLFQCPSKICFKTIISCSSKD